jgi:hypothetical protein
MKLFGPRKIFVCLLWGMVFIATLEFCARLDDLINWNAPFFGQYSHEILWQTTAWGHGGRPNAKFEKWEINSHGFRSGEIGQDNSSYEIRVLVMGASETFGLYESSGHAFPELLDEDLNRDFPGYYNVINTGFPGMSLPRMLDFFRAIADRIKPDVVIVYPSPQFYLDSSPPSETITKPTISQKDTTAKFTFRLKRKISMVLKKILPHSLQTFIRRLKIEYTRRRLSIDVWQSPPLKHLEAFRWHLEHLIEEIRSNECKVILATHANRFGVRLNGDDDFFIYSWIAHYPSATPACMLETEKLANNIIKNVSKKYGIPLVDLAAALSDEATYFADFSHFTDKGSALVAKLLAETVVELDPPKDLE